MPIGTKWGKRVYLNLFNLLANMPKKANCICSNIVSKVVGGLSDIALRIPAALFEQPETLNRRWVKMWQEGLVFGGQQLYIGLKHAPGCFINLIVSDQSTNNQLSPTVKYFATLKGENL
jgi:hypothetical protein